MRKKRSTHFLEVRNAILAGGEQKKKQPPERIEMSNARWGIGNNVPVMCSTSHAQAVAGMAVVLAQWLIFVSLWSSAGRCGARRAVFPPFSFKKRTTPNKKCTTTSQARNGLN
jgi:hypothetical protein